MGLKSMTGFGRCELKSARGHIRVEIKTINHKFFELSSRLSSHLTEFEDSIRKKISQEIRRGKVSLLVSSPDPAVFSSHLVLNEPLAKEVFHKVEKLKTLLKLKALAKNPADYEGKILSEILRYPDVLTKDSSINERSVLFHEVEKAVSQAIVSLRRSRILEGRSIERDFIKRLGEIDKALKVIEKRIPLLAKEFKKVLEKRTKEFLKDGQIDHDRLTMEAALYVKNADISEEVTRLRHHIVAMKKTLHESGELGRKIDFIAQEMYRESNTMGAKSSDVSIANHVIQVKSAIEKIREQAQNVE